MSANPAQFKELKAEQFSQFEHDRIVVPDDLKANVLVTSLDKVYNWSRKTSMFRLLFGLACCAIEMIATAATRYDLARFGMEVMRPSPRQSDLMIVSGTHCKVAPLPVKRGLKFWPGPMLALSRAGIVS